MKSDAPSQPNQPGTVIAPSSSRSPDPAPLELRHRLQDQLMELSFHAFEECIRDLLSRLGYSQVQMVGRTTWRGRTHKGGRDLEATADVGITRARIVIQVKQYERPVQRRFVDELRGVMARLNAKHGLLITTSSFPDVARNAANQGELLPVTLLDGPGLIEAMLCVHLGVHREKKGKWSLDEGYFGHLNKEFPKHGSSRSGERSVTSRLAQEAPINEGGDMTWRTHVLAGMTTVWLVDVIPNAVTTDNVAILLIAAAFGALLPDLDSRESKIKSLEVGGIRPFVPLSSVVHQAWGHRGPLHQNIGLLLAGVLALILARLSSSSIGLALWLGYASHLAADACTRSGIPLFSGRPRFFLLPAVLRFRTGSQAEDVLLPFLAAATALIVFSHLPH